MSSLTRNIQRKVNRKSSDLALGRGSKLGSGTLTVMHGRVRGSRRGTGIGNAVTNDNAGA